MAVVRSTSIWRVGVLVATLVLASGACSQQASDGSADGPATSGSTAGTTSGSTAGTTTGTATGVPYTFDEIRAFMASCVAGVPEGAAAAAKPLDYCGCVLRGVQRTMDHDAFVAANSAAAAGTVPPELSTVVDACNADVAAY